MKKIAVLVVFLLFLTACASRLPADVTVTATSESVPSATLTDTPASTMTPTPTAAETAAPLTTITPEETNLPTATTSPTPTRPVSYLISPIYGERQAFPLSCESRAAVDWAGYYGAEILEGDFQFQLPFSDNPDFGFVGTVNGPWGQVPPFDYGVHAAPVAAVLREYGVPAVAEKNMDMAQLKDIIAQGHPVLAWVIGNVVGGVPYVYTDSLGNQVTVAAYEHVVIVIGYDDEADTIIYMNNGKFYTTPAWVFENSWSVLEYMAIYYED